MNTIPANLRCPVDLRNPVETGSIDETAYSERTCGDFLNHISERNRSKTPYTYIVSLQVIVLEEKEVEFLVYTGNSHP